MADEFRRARVNRDPEGQPIGCAVFLSDEELQELGFELETTYEIEYHIEDSAVRLEKPVPDEATEISGSEDVDTSSAASQVTQKGDSSTGDTMDGKGDNAGYGVGIGRGEF